MWLQVNARPVIRPWHAEVLARVASQWSRIIVQVSGAAMREGLMSLHGTLDRLAADRDKITLLLDPSGGSGRRIHDNELTVAEAAAFLGYYHDWNWALAGGLTPDNVSALRPLFGAHKDVSGRLPGVDVETGVRDADDHLDIEKARRFWSEARKLYVAAP